MRVAEIDAFLDEEADRLPFLAVAGLEDAQLAVAADMGVGLAEDAVPFAAPANEIGEGVVFTLIPDLLHRHEPRCLRGTGVGREEDTRDQEGESSHDYFWRREVSSSPSG